MRSTRSRASGLLLHVTSLPGGHGIGDLGPEAYGFVDFLAASGQKWWQMLPFGPVGAGNSPYSSPSAFAGNGDLISLELLTDMGLLSARDLRPTKALTDDRVTFAAVRSYKERRLRRSFKAFDGNEPSDYLTFLDTNRKWLDDWTLFAAAAGAHPGKSWTAWPRALRDRDAGSLRRFAKKHAAEIRYQRFVQYVFASQWRQLADHAKRRRVALLGDIPIYVAGDSADAWSNSRLFRLDRRGLPTAVAGVPPDPFSPDGQRWGNPLYDWQRLADEHYGWWIERFETNLARFDAIRLDHFIGLQNYYEIPAHHRTARNGQWRPGPGADLLRTVEETVGTRRLVVEDLGAITDEVAALRDRFRLPGMRILQFGFDDNDASHLPEAHPKRVVAYTGTHDNDTIMGWLRSLPASVRRRATAYARQHAPQTAKPGADLHFGFIAALMSSRAALAIVPVQDLLGLGSAARMNRPGTARGNWGYRLQPGALDEPLAKRLLELTRRHDR